MIPKSNHLTYSVNKKTDTMATAKTKSTRKRTDATSKLTGNLNKKEATVAPKKVDDAINAGQDSEDSTVDQLQTNFIIQMNGMDTAAPVFYHEYFFSDPQEM